MNIAIILSGGVGTRMGGNVPKQYMVVAGNPVIYYCLRTFIEFTEIDAVIVVVSKEWKQYVESVVEGLNPNKPVYYSHPGETRQFSVYNGLNEASRRGAQVDDIVIIHDAARPMVSTELVSECLKCCSEADGVLPVVPVKDTLYQSKDGHNITSLLNRSELFAGQAPEAFLFGKYYALHNEMSHDDILKINGSTEIAYKGGLQIKLIRGDEMNFKITTPEDLSNFDSIIRAKGV